MASGILILAIIGIVTLISIQNVTAVSLSLLYWRFETTLPVLIFVSVFFGVAVEQLIRRWLAGRNTKGNET